MPIPSLDPEQLETLLAIMKALRDPQTGCPWDVEQDFKSITRYTIEEAYEVVDAIERDDMPELCDELGDLLLQVVFHAQMADERGSFSFKDVVKAISTKMIRRHPHVFGAEHERGIKPKRGFWEDIKATEKSSEKQQKKSLLDNVPRALPALSRANKLQAKAARVGFDWPDVTGVYDKINEEIAEIRSAAAGGNADEIATELGDLLFSAVNLTRHYGHDPEMVLRRANDKFQRRFNHMEQNAHLPLEDIELNELEQLWKNAKATE